MRLDLRAGSRYNEAYDAACEVIFCGLAGLGPESEIAGDLFEREFDYAMNFLEHNHPQKLDVLLIAALPYIEQHPLRAMDE